MYKIECGDCNVVYVGQTSWTLEERVAEHDPDVDAVDLPESVFARHIIATGHKHASKTITLFYYWPKGRVLIKLEEIEIIKHKKLENAYTVLNDTKHVLFDILVSFLFDFALESRWILFLLHGFTFCIDVSVAFLAWWWLVQPSETAVATGIVSRLKIYFWSVSFYVFVLLWSFWKILFWTWPLFRFSLTQNSSSF